MLPGYLFGECQMKMNRREFLMTAGASLSAMVTLDSVLPAGSISRPNILFFYPDQHRFDWTSIPGRDAFRRMPYGTDGTGLILSVLETINRPS